MLRRKMTGSTMVRSLMTTCLSPNAAIEAAGWNNATAAPTSSNFSGPTMYRESQDFCDKGLERSGGAAMNRGDIYLASLDPAEGREQRGYRPVLVVSPAAFNAATKRPVVPPITTAGEFARRIGLAVPIPGIKTTGVVRCDQPRVLDLNAGTGRKVDAMPAAIMDDVMARLATILE